MIVELIDTILQLLKDWKGWVVRTEEKKEMCLPDRKLNRFDGFYFEMSLLLVSDARMRMSSIRQSSA